MRGCEMRGYWGGVRWEVIERWEGLRNERVLRDERVTRGFLTQGPSHPPSAESHPLLPPSRGTALALCVTPPPTVASLTATLVLLQQRVDGLEWLSRCGEQLHRLIVLPFVDVSRCHDGWVRVRVTVGVGDRTVTLHWEINKLRQPDMLPTRWYHHGSSVKLGYLG